MRAHRIVTGAVLTAALAGCTGESGGSRTGDPTGNPTTATATTPGSPGATESPTTAATTRGPATPGAQVVGTIATGLDTPWGIAFLPDGSALVGSRDTAEVVQVSGGRVSRVGTIPGVRHGGEGGLLGLVVSPTFDRDRLVYAYFTSADDNRIVRMTFTGGRLGEPRPILTGIPRAGNHNGGGLAFGPDGMLYASTGESGNPELAQRRSSLGGKVLRMRPDGSVPPGNPFPGSVVWSYGHRNVEGIAFDAAGRLWATEFGSTEWDELNQVRRGANYGWPAAEGRTSRGGLTNPLAQWRTDDAGPAGLAVKDGVAWFGGLTGHRLYRVQLDGDRAGSSRTFFQERYGRLRAVAFAPDGLLWLTTSNRDGRGDPRSGDDRILLVRVS